MQNSKLLTRQRHEYLNLSQIICQYFLYPFFRCPQSSMFSNRTQILRNSPCWLETKYKKSQALLLPAPLFILFVTSKFEIEYQRNDIFIEFFNQILIYEGKKRSNQKDTAQTSSTFKKEADTAAVGYSFIIFMIANRKIVNIAATNRDITFEWNHHPPISPVYYRHVIIVYHNIAKIAKAFVQDYIDQIKQGDYYSTLYVNNQLVLRKRLWKQKTVNTSFDINSYIADQDIFSQLRDRLIDILEQEAEAVTDPVIVNVLLQHANDAEWFVSKIKHRRIHNRLNYVFSLFAPFQDSKFSVGDGINKISFSEDNRSKMIACWLAFAAQAAIFRAKLTVTCLNGDISSCDEGEWRNTSFNQIVRDYYHPSAHYDKDILSFVGGQYQGSEEVRLLVELTYHCFGQSPCKNSKVITVNIQQNKSMDDCQTIGKNKLYLMKEQMQMSESPYQSTTNVKYVSGMYSSTQHIE